MLVAIVIPRVLVLGHAQALISIYQADGVWQLIPGLRSFISYLASIYK
jgi:hypothetical protein